MGKILYKSTIKCKVFEVRKNKPRNLFFFVYDDIPEKKCKQKIEKHENVKHITCLERKPEKTINSKQETWLAFKEQQVSQEI